MRAQALPHGLLVPGLHEGRQPLREEGIGQALVLLATCLPLLRVHQTGSARDQRQTGCTVTCMHTANMSYAAP